MFQYSDCPWRRSTHRSNKYCNIFRSILSQTRSNPEYLIPSISNRSSTTTMDRMYNKFRRSRSPIRRDDRDEFRSRKRDNYRYNIVFVFYPIEFGLLESSFQIFCRSPSPVTRRSNHSSSHRSRSRSPRDRKGHGGNRVNSYEERRCNLLK